MKRRTVLAATLIALASVIPAGRQARAGDVPVIAAASGVQPALEEIAAEFEAATARQVSLAFGSSGNLTRQIRQGAPFQLFLSADEGFPLALAGEGFARDRGVVYATGRLALVVPHGSPLAADGTLEDLRAALAEGRVSRFAIASPIHAPYGIAARQALENAGLWAAIKPRLVYGENIAQAAQFAVSGSAEGGIIAGSLAGTPKLAAISDVAPIPDATHAPLRHRMVLLTGAGETAEAFHDWLRGPEARAIFERHGFRVPVDPS